MIVLSRSAEAHTLSQHLVDMIPINKFGRHTSPATDWDRKYDAEGPASSDLSAYAAQPFVQTILKHMPVGQRILDAGCGTGRLLRFLKQRGGDVTGVDTSAKAIEILRRTAPDIHAQVASIEHLPFPDAGFDAYLAIGSWEYPSAGPEQAAREAARVLKNGGLAFIEVPQASLLRTLTYLPLKRLEHIFQAIKGNTPEFSHHVFSRTDLETVLHRNGFDVLEVHPHDLPEPNRHYGLWVDWPFLRARPAKPSGRSGGEARYELNTIGRIMKTVGNTLSSWTIATGMFIVARKK